MQELIITQYAISKYRRLSKYIEFTNNDKVVSKIVQDISIMKENCKFGLWYYGDGQDYIKLEAFQNIDVPYTEVFKSYFKLLVFIQTYNDRTIFKKVFQREKRQSDLLKLRIKQVKDKCLILVELLKKLELEYIKMDFEYKANIDIAKQAINKELDEIKSKPVVNETVIKDEIQIENVKNIKAEKITLDTPKFQIKYNQAYNQSLVFPTKKTDIGDKKSGFTIKSNIDKNENSLSTLLKMNRNIK